MQKVNNIPERLFLTRLSESYKCRAGDNVLLECYVRCQRIKSIAWYANGEPVDVRGVRIWHRYDPATGHCMLCIRSVLDCDSGSYHCEATSRDNVVETLEVKLTTDDRDKVWKKIPILNMAGRVMPGGAKKLMTSCPT
ncbi:unnamed protein product [Adineta ricciae]|uniref:Ig-like domain-containing protein n=1 Tax=Adineta ricciae TaxID=249248 RepID=A0A814AJJ2_ADIRI|nr:unnamed protein product [Adineta ricciae]CAF1126099.1 unnamed protein product [Adineta ricciae]